MSCFSQASEPQLRVQDFCFSILEQSELSWALICPSQAQAAQLKSPALNMDWQWNLKLRKLPPRCRDDQSFQFLSWSSCFLIPAFSAILFHMFVHAFDTLKIPVHCLTCEILSNRWFATPVCDGISEKSEHRNRDLSCLQMCTEDQLWYITVCRQVFDCIRLFTCPFHFHEFVFYTLNHWGLMRLGKDWTVILHYYLGL